MGVIRSIINFLMRFDTRLKIEEPIIVPVVKRNWGVSQEIKDVVFGEVKKCSDGKYFTVKSLSNTVGISRAATGKAVKSLLLDGVLECAGYGSHKKFRLLTGKPPEKELARVEELVTPRPVKSTLLIMEKIMDYMGLLLPGEGLTRRQMEGITECSQGQIQTSIRYLVRDGLIVANETDILQNRAYKLVVKAEPYPELLEPIWAPVMYKCSKCGILKEESAFGKHGEERTKQCKKCRCEQQKKSRALKKAAATAERVIPPLIYKTNSRGEVIDLSSGK